MRALSITTSSNSGLTLPAFARAEAKLARELAIVPPCSRSAGNLTGNAHDLWVTGAGTMRGQLATLDELAAKTAASGRALKQAVAAAREATAGFVAWLDEQAPSKSGPSGIGKDNYNWLLKNVYLVPMTWDQEVDLLKRELARAHASLKLEEARNAGLPELPVIQSPEEYQRRGNEAITRYLDFLRKRDLYPMRDSMDAALRAKIGAFVPLETRNFFAIATHYEPLTLYTHFYHWWDLARMRAGRTRARSGAARCSTTSGIRAPKAWRRRWKSSCCTPGFSTRSRARRRSSGSCWRSAPRAASPRSMRRRTSST
jgi:hypothetical protein